MKALSEDTTPEIECILVEGYRRMPPQQKLAQVSGLSIAVQRLALARIRATYPNATEHELRLRVASLWIDRESMRRAFGWDPLKEGF